VEQEGICAVVAGRCEVGLQREHLRGRLAASRRGEALCGRTEKRLGTVQLSEFELPLAEQGLGCRDCDGVAALARPPLGLGGRRLDLVPIICESRSAGRLEEHAW
jgi:hypothetical protein